MTEQKDTAPAKKAVRKVGTNPLTLPWPRDLSGVSYKIQGPGTNAVSHINGNREVLDVFLETLEILRLHAIESFKSQVAYRKSLIETANRREELEAEQREQTRLRTIAALKAQIETLGGEPEETKEEGDA